MQIYIVGRFCDRKQNQVLKNNNKLCGYAEERKEGQLKLDLSLCRCFSSSWVWTNRLC